MKTTSSLVSLPDCTSHPYILPLSLILSRNIRGGSVQLDKSARVMGGYGIIFKEIP